MEQYEQPATDERDVLYPVFHSIQAAIEALTLEQQVTVSEFLTAHAPRLEANDFDPAGHELVVLLQFLELALSWEILPAETADGIRTLLSEFHEKLREEETPSEANIDMESVDKAEAEKMEAAFAQLLEVGRDRLRELTGAVWQTLRPFFVQMCGWSETAARVIGRKGRDSTLSLWVQTRKHLPVAGKFVHRQVLRIYNWIQRSWNTVYAFTARNSSRVFSFVAVKAKTVLGFFQEQLAAIGDWLQRKATEIYPAVLVFAFPEGAAAPTQFEAERERGFYKFIANSIQEADSIHRECEASGGRYRYRVVRF